MTVKPVRDGFHTITPYLFVQGTARLVEFLTAAFDGKVTRDVQRPDGSTAHIEMQVGDSMLMLGEPIPEIGPMPTSIYLYVSDSDAVYARALRAGGISLFPVTTLPSGQRYGGVKDPSGNIWWIATNVEDVPLDEEQKRWAEFYKNMGRK